jgi:hypothetical protein
MITSCGSPDMTAWNSRVGSECERLEKEKHIDSSSSPSLISRRPGKEPGGLALALSRSLRKSFRGICVENKSRAGSELLLRWPDRKIKGPRVMGIARHQRRQR